MIIIAGTVQVRPEKCDEAVAAATEIKRYDVATVTGV
jgi:hypothetical protein